VQCILLWLGNAGTNNYIDPNKAGLVCDLIHSWGLYSSNYGNRYLEQ